LVAVTKTFLDAQEGALESGDFLVIDNAKIHHTADAKAFVEQLLTMHGVEYKWLPKYW
jgi:hypothetical protein